MLSACQRFIPTDLSALIHYFALRPEVQPLPVGLHRELVLRCWSQIVGLIREDSQGQFIQLGLSVIRSLSVSDINKQARMDLTQCSDLEDERDTVF